MLMAKTSEDPNSFRPRSNPILLIMQLYVNLKTSPSKGY
jgi:hypothetical protein